MKVSTIIPVFNKAKTVQRALYSVIDQECVDGVDVEIIIVDDGSSDESVSVIKSVIRKSNHANITLLRQTNGGVSRARNAGVALASGELITFLDADDTYKPTFLNTILDLYKSFPEAHFYATAYHFVNTNSGEIHTANSGTTQSDHGPHILNNFFAKSQQDRYKYPRDLLVATNCYYVFPECANI